MRSKTNRSATRLRTVLAVWIAATAAACVPAVSRGAAADEDAAPWRPLFDGKTLAGWHQVGDGEWVVEDGAIVGRTQEAAKLYGLLVSDGVYHDFTVRFKFKSIKGNSGFYVRTVLESPGQGPRPADRGRPAEQLRRHLRELRPRRGSRKPEPDDARQVLQARRLERGRRSRRTAAT